MARARRSLTTLFLSLSISVIAHAEILKLDDSTIDPQALCFTNGSWGIAINGLAFQQDALTTFHDWQYATYFDFQRHLCVARRELHIANAASAIAKPSPWQTIRFTDYLFKGNDAHNVAVIGICPKDGTIHLSFDHHGHPLHYRVSQPGVALHPNKIAWSTNLFSPITSELVSGKKLNHVTYPRFVRTPEGGLQFDCRIGGSGNGDEYLADYLPSSHSWTNFGIYISGKGIYDNDTTRNAYINSLTYDRLGRLHVTWNWRETGDPMSNHDLDYAWSDDRGVNWRNTIGNPIARRGQHAITLDSAGVRVVEIPTKRGLSNSTTQALDSRNRIHLVQMHLPDDLSADKTWDATRRKLHFFHYWRDDTGKWHRNQTTFNGSRPQLWFDTNDNAYLAFVGDRRIPSQYLTIARATAANHWTDWKPIRQEKGPFIGQVQIDHYTPPGILSIYIQEEPHTKKATSSSLKVFTFAATN